MNKPRIVKGRVNNAVRGALSRALPTWREKVSIGVIATAILLFTGWYWRYGGSWKLDSQRDAQVANGWVTNCNGPQFSNFSHDDSAGPGPARPVFRITDQLVLAVPKGNRPSAGRIEREPHECRTLSDLPQVAYLYFVIWGKWSGSYNPKDVPLDGGKKQFLPDAVTVRIERETLGTSSIEDQSRIASVKEFYDNLLSKREIGGLTCGRHGIPPDPSRKGGLFCSGHRTPADPDTIAFRTFSYDTPFVLIDADYPSTHYGGIHVYWSVWTLDVANGPDIDQAVWKSLTDWNLVSESATLPGQ
jgi:hypothetical protein